MATQPIIRRVSATRYTPFVRSLELGRPKDTFFGDQEYFAYSYEGNIKENIGESTPVTTPTTTTGSITGYIDRALAPVTGTTQVISPTCPPGTHWGMPPCPTGFACVQRLSCVPDSAAAPGTSPGETPATNPLQDIINAIGGAIGGIGGQFPVGTAGTRVVQPVEGAKKNPLVTLLLLAGIGGVGYYLYKRYKKGT